MRRVSQAVQLQFVRAWKSLSAVRARVGLRVERPGVTPGRPVVVEGLVTPRTRVHPGHGVGVAGGVGAQDVDLVEALVTQPAHVVLGARVHLAVARECRVVHEPTITHLQP